MTQLDSPGAEEVPCHSCSASAEALRIMAMALFKVTLSKISKPPKLTRLCPAAQYIRVPISGESMSNLFPIALTILHKEHCHSVKWHPIKPLKNSEMSVTASDIAWWTLRDLIQAAKSHYFMVKTWL